MGFFKTSDVSKECKKAAHILKTFIDKGRLPIEAIKNAKGLAIFTGFRAGMYFAGSGGSGVVVARLPDGTWSPPSAFSVRSGAFGLVGGVDVYDCICVLNTQAAVDAYSNPEVNLGAGAALAAGPVGGNTSMKEAKPVWTYTKSRGIYGGVTVDGTIIKENAEANASFYGSKITTAQILKGEAEAQEGPSKWPAGAKHLTEALKMAEGKSADAKTLQDISSEEMSEELKH